MSPSDEAAALPTSQKAGWASFIKSLAGVSGDLSSISAPSFILSPVSLAEFPSYWGEATAQFAAIPSGKTPEERHLLVTKWYISTLAGQFYRREKETGSEKKPLNPILGEQFIGNWDDGETTLSAEQVSHHPPITAYYLENKKAGISLEGNNAQKTSFSLGKIVVKQVGHAILRVTLSGGEEEQYLITLPKLNVEGIIMGSPYVELTEHSYIQAGHGLLTSFSYSGKGYFSGKSHSFVASITSPTLSIPLYTISGTWTSISNYTKPSTHPQLEGTLFLDASISHTPISVKPIVEQTEMESRKVWQGTAEGIKKGDFESATREKVKIENEERKKRKEELDQGKKFQLGLFEKVEGDGIYEKLAVLCKHKPEKEDSYKFKGRQ